MYLDEWGPIAWELLHYITYTYKPYLKNYYIIFFNTLYAIIPCPNCSRDIKNILLLIDNYPIANIKSRKSIIEWMIKIHNIVNKKTNNKNNFTIEDSNNKYIKHGNINIDHERIFKFINLAIKSKIKENNIDLFRNIISLCHIYPVDIDKSNIGLIKFIVKNMINDNTWINEFKNIDKNNDLLNISHINFNNLFAYSDKKIYLNKFILKDTHNNLNNNVMDEKKGNIIFSSKNKDNIYHIRTYEFLENISSVRLYISGMSTKCNTYITVKLNNSKKKNKLYSYLDFKYENIKIGDTATILIEIKDKEYNSFSIIDSLYFF